MTARIAGVNIPMQKHARIALRAIYGIGPTLADLICTGAKVNPAAKIKDLTEAELEALRVETAKHVVEGELRRELR